MHDIQKYSAEKRLMENQKYTFSFVVDGVECVYSFTSRYSPLYSTIKVIRSDYWELLEELTDELVLFHIWQNSQLVREIADVELNFPDDKPNYAVKQYVRYKTEYDLVRALLITISTKAGAQEKHLGEFKITNEYKTPELEEILKRLKELVDEWEKALGVVVAPRGAVKAGRNFPFPLNGRVSF
jgi:hypothetical protein